MGTCSFRYDANPLDQRTCNAELRNLQQEPLFLRAYQ
jgi:hypothetical protein